MAHLRQWCLCNSLIVWFQSEWPNPRHLPLVILRKGVKFLCLCHLRNLFVDGNQNVTYELSLLVALIFFSSHVQLVYEELVCQLIHSCGCYCWGRVSIYLRLGTRWARLSRFGIRNDGVGKTMMTLHNRNFCGGIRIIHILQANFSQSPGMTHIVLIRRVK